MVSKELDLMRFSRLSSRATDLFGESSDYERRWDITCGDEVFELFIVNSGSVKTLRVHTGDVRSSRRIWFMDRTGGLSFREFFVAGADPNILKEGVYRLKETWKDPDAHKIEQVDVFDEFEKLFDKLRI